MLVVEKRDLFLWMKAKRWFWSFISLIINASFVVIVTWPFHIWNLFPFLVGLYRNLVIFRFVLSIFIATFMLQKAAVMLQTIPSSYTNFSEKSLFISANTYEKKTLSVETIASPITTTTRVFYRFVGILLYYLEMLKSYKRGWIYFASPINTWIVCLHYSSIDSVEKLLQRVDKCLITCNGQITFITETRELTECWALR